MPKPNAVIITGAGRRLGRALALAAAQKGFAVVGHYHASRAGILDMAGAVRKLGRPFYEIRADLRTPPEGFLKKCAALPVAVRGLVNNASMFEKGNFMDRPAAFMRGVLHVNAFSPLMLGLDFARIIKKGFIINIADANVRSFNRHFQIYRLSKRMLLDFTRECALLLAPRVRVNAIAPGAILPSRFDSAEAALKKAKKAPLGRGGDIPGMVRAFEYLADADGVTGQVMYVDGGMHLL